ncbi:hypothetical protein [Candidatus Uabimicrobium sp. HlEnr_7]|uniref:hypothetical protein n=1 Tax=Candidatus Uabimicrobium helgolandensis TaxID=3095367 RepID=UPI0035567BDB
MKKWSIQFQEKYTGSPLTYWVHKAIGNSKYEPPLPKPVAGKGFAVLIVEIAEIELFFSSVNEVDHFLEVISQKNMPTSMQLSKIRGASYGPNKHWLSRLPGKIKPWRKRQRLIKILEKARKEFIINF